MSDPWSTQPVASPAKPEWLTEDLETKLRAKQLPLDQDGLLMLHQQSKQQLDFWKAEEMELRKLTVQVLIPEKTEGTNTVDLGNGWQAKAKIKYNYKLDPDNDKVWAGLERIEKIGNEGKFIADRLVSWTPNFLLTEYRQLQEDSEKGSLFAQTVLKEIESFLTISEAAPELEIKEPKKGKK